MLDERHPGLGSHLEEVASLAVACAESLGLSADDVQLVERAAELHDIGKVGIPSEILTKHGPLGDEELAFMRRHSVIGERILSGLPSLERAAAVVRSSHERWDGEWLSRPVCPETRFRSRPGSSSSPTRTAR